jgi:hypothetical protein
VYIQGLNPRFYELAAAGARYSGIGSVVAVPKLSFDLLDGGQAGLQF